MPWLRNTPTHPAVLVGITTYIVSITRDDVVPLHWTFIAIQTRLHTLARAYIKEIINNQRHWSLWGELICDRWIPHTESQLHGKCFHLMTSSCNTEPPRIIIYTWAKVLHIFKGAKRLGNVCENCSNYLYQHTTQAFCDISDKVLLLWFIAHWENDDDPWQHVAYQKASLPFACGRHLELGTTRWLFHIYCQYTTKKVPTLQHVCKVAKYWTSKIWLKTNGHCQPLWWWPKWCRQNFV